MTACLDIPDGKLDGADAEDINATGANLVKVSAKATDFTGGTLDGAKAKAIDLTGATLVDASAKSTNLKKANLSSADAARLGVHPTCASTRALVEAGAADNLVAAVHSTTPR